MSKNLGGFGLPDILYFTHASHFRHIADWLLNSLVFSNYELERALFAPYSPSALLHTPKHLLPEGVGTSLLLSNMHNSWTAINRHLGKNSSHSPFNTFWRNPCFIPGMENNRFVQMREKGISAIKDVFDPGGDIPELFGLPNCDFYMFLQIRHFVQSHSDHKLPSRTAAPFSQIIALSKSKLYKIRYLYSLLLKPTVARAWKKTFNSWSRDIPSIGTPDDLLKGCEFGLRYLPSAALQETHLKTISRAYISQSQRKHMVPYETGRCCKCGAADATFFHNFWDCSKIKRFWNKLMGYLNAVFSLHLVKNPRSCLLLDFSDWDLGSIPNSITPILVIILTVAKHCILTHWITRAPPFLHEV